ncbi:ATPase, T2SS/T4P/T4SS family [Magnetofaba australis]|uniref:Putative type II secretion system protein E n=1 Tax=Magnetofaba australis IT-1 TaxID=1434232 RepID=A0A1Y2K9Y7_9PROT|nr:ATPase, T2SS/T4P/T4SS family [Magnetofaba australis]OSM07331.1 putative type II secretion system protein E [Magnetofaba australis IT-1]
MQSDEALSTGLRPAPSQIKALFGGGGAAFSALLTDEWVDWLVERLTVLTVDAGDYLCRQGEASPGLSWVAQGRARAVNDEHPRNPFVMQVFGEGGYFCEEGMFEAHAAFSIQATEKLSIFRLSPQHSAELAARLPQLAEQLQFQRRYLDKIKFLSNVKLLQELVLLDLERLAATMETVALESGEYLFHENDAGGSAFVIYQGALEIIKESTGNLHVVSLSVGDVVGEMSLVDGLPRNAGARASQPTVVWRLLSGSYLEVIDASLKKQVDERLVVHQAMAFDSHTSKGQRNIVSAFSHAEDLQRYWELIKQERKPIVEALAEVAQVLEMDYLAPSSNVLMDPELLRHVPHHYAQAHQVLPIYRVGDRVEALSVTPFLGGVLTELTSLLGQRVALRLTEPEFLNKLIESRYGADTGLSGSLSDLGDIGNYDELDTIEDLVDQAQAAPIIKLVNNFFVDSIANKSSDIHIEPYEEHLEVRFRTDGILHPVSTFPRKLQGAIVSRIKIMANLDIAERRSPQDGAISLRLEGKSFDIRVATVPTVFGEGVVMRILDKSNVQIDLEQIGFSEQTLTLWREAIGNTNGVILVTGPTGSGKTTSLYATLNHVKSPEVKVITTEDPVEYQLAGIKQIQVNPKVNLTFATALRSILRLDPDIIMVGEIRDEETANIAIESALTGHLVFSTLHTNDAPASMTRLIEMGIEPYLVASAVKAVLAQRLVRRLCPACREQDDSGVWRAVGCKACGQSGYKGRLGIYELMLMSDPLRALVNERADARVLSLKAQEMGMVTLRQDGEEKAAAGFTTLEEVRRVVN